MTGQYLLDDDAFDSSNNLVVTHPGYYVDVDGDDSYGKPRNADGKLRNADDVDFASTTNNNLYKRTEQDLIDSTRWPEPNWWRRWRPLRI